MTTMKSLFNHSNPMIHSLGMQWYPIYMSGHRWLVQYDGTFKGKAGLHVYVVGVYLPTQYLPTLFSLNLQVQCTVSPFPFVHHVNNLVLLNININKSIKKIEAYFKFI